VQLDEQQVNELIDIARRWNYLADLVVQVSWSMSPDWDRALAETELELRRATEFLLDIVRPAVPGIAPANLEEQPFLRDASAPFDPDQALELAEIARIARVRSHQLRPVLAGLPEDSVEFWDARKIVDRLHFYAGELLEMVSLVDPERARRIVADTAR
jgi:hypothetical protein